MTPEQTALFRSMLGYSNSSNIPGQQGALGTNSINSGTGATNSALGGLANFNPFATNNIGNDVNAGNAYAAGADIPAQVKAAMFPAEQTARDVTLPGIDSSAAASGNTNSSRTGVAEGLVQRGLAENSQNLAANLEANYYNTGAGLGANANTANNSSLLSALGAEGQLGGANNALGLGALSSALGNQGQLFNLGSEGGAGLQQGNQLGDTNQMQKWQFGTNSPFASLDNFYNIIGSNNWGNQTSGTSTTQSTPSFLSMLGGLMGAGGSLMGGGGGLGGMSSMFQPAGGAMSSMGMGPYAGYSSALGSMGAGVTPFGSVFML